MRKRSNKRKTGNREKIKVLIDSREQRPWNLSSFDTQVVALPTGDYCLADVPHIVIERKSLDDFCNCIAHDSERFEKQITRLSALPGSFIIVEANPTSLITNPTLTRVHGHSIMGKAAAIQARAGVPVLFMQRKAAEYYVTRFFGHLYRASVHR